VRTWRASNSNYGKTWRKICTVSVTLSCIRCVIMEPKWISRIITTKLSGAFSFYITIRAHFSTLIRNSNTFQRLDSPWGGLLSCSQGVQASESITKV
jgi:hypothetical protein